MGYGASTRPLFGAYSRESQLKLRNQQRQEERRAEEQPAGSPLIDRAPGSFTQPLTTSQIQSTTPTQPFVKSQAFGDDVSNTTPAADDIDDDEASTSDNGHSDINPSEFEDEFEIPAFMRKRR